MTRLLTLVLLLLCASVAPAWASNCSWICTPNISQPDLNNDTDSGECGVSTWTWMYVAYADHLHIYGTTSANAYRYTINIAAAAAGNGTYTVQRITACPRPVEDIEGDARNEFKARAEINDDTSARARGSKRIKGSKMSLDCHVHGGVEATSAGYSDGPGGALTIPLYPGGPNTTVYWSKGGATEQVFQASDSGTGGQSPEVVTCQTSVDLALSVGWWDDWGQSDINGSKAELNVYGTCDGACNVCWLVLHVSQGY